MYKKIVWLGFSNTWKNAKDIKEYISLLIKSWADEFFVWYNPPYWYEKFWFEVSPNMRFAEHEQVNDFDTLKQITQEIHSHKLEIFANLNFWYYTDETFPFIQKIIQEFEEIWIDWIICSSISVLEYLKSIKYKGKINISTITSLYNTESIRFFLKNYDVNKIILSRELTLKEIEELLNAFPNTKFEVFWEWDFCRYNNWLCFAEHKYWSKDICTIVVNDLIIKNKFRSDFKKIILNKEIENNDKSSLLNSNYQNIFQQIEEILLLVNTWLKDELKAKNELKNIIIKSKSRVDLYYDAMKPIDSEHNKNILVYFKALKYLEIEDFEWLKKELERSIKSAIEYYNTQSKTIGGESKLKAKELASFYSRNDLLNLYSYLFFSQFKNLDTVKFPTRWRNYNEKLKIIEEIVKNKKVDLSILNRWVSLERSHYDLTYLFWDKLWFRDLIKNFY